MVATTHKGSLACALARVKWLPRGCETHGLDNRGRLIWRSAAELEPLPKELRCAAARRNGRKRRLGDLEGMA